MRAIGSNRKMLLLLDDVLFFICPYVFTHIYIRQIYFLQQICAISLSTDIGIVSHCKSFLSTDPRNVEVTFEPKERRVIVSLDNQEGRAIGYVVLCRSSDNIDCGRQVLSGITSFPVTSLSPYHNYSFTVMTTVTGLGVDNKTVQATYIQQTLEDGERSSYACLWLLATVLVYVDILQQCMLVFIYG